MLCCETDASEVTVGKNSTRQNLKALKKPFFKLLNKNIYHHMQGEGIKWNNAQHLFFAFNISTSVFKYLIKILVWKLLWDYTLVKFVYCMEIVQ